MLVEKQAGILIHTSRCVFGVKIGMSAGEDELVIYSKIKNMHSLVTQRSSRLVYSLQ